MVRNSNFLTKYLALTFEMDQIKSNWCELTRFEIRTLNNDRRKKSYSVRRIRRKTRKGWSHKTHQSCFQSKTGIGIFDFIIYLRTILATGPKPHAPETSHSLELITLLAL